MSRKLPKSLTQEQVDALLGELRGNSRIALRNRAVLTVMADGGLRVGEVCNLETSDLVWDKGECVKLHLSHTKNARERIVPLTTRARDSLARWLECRDGVDSEYVFCTLSSGTHKYPRTGADGDFVKGEPTLEVELRPGRNLSAPYIRRVVKRLAAKAGIKRSISPHTLRHTAAQRLYDSSGDLELVRRFLGHVRIGTTQVYAQANDVQVQAAVAGLEEASGVEDILGEIDTLRARVVALGQAGR